MTTFKEMFQERKINANQDDEMFLHMVVEQTFKETKKEMEELLKQHYNKLNNVLEEIENNIRNEIIKLAENHNNNKILPLKGADGKTPTKQELIELIKPLIPQIKDGKTPTQRELLELINPLIPEKVDGNYIMEKILAQLKLPKTPTAEAIADMVLEKLKEEKITIDEIEGLRNILSTLNKNIVEMKGKAAQKVGGGGMGNPTAFSFTGDGVTTSFTLSARVAANGKAIIAHYQGQYIHINQHFTISGVTLSTTFTPEDGATIEGWFIRT